MSVLNFYRDFFNVLERPRTETVISFQGLGSTLLDNLEMDGATGKPGGVDT